MPDMGENSCERASDVVRNRPRSEVLRYHDTQNRLDWDYEVAKAMLNESVRSFDVDRQKLG